MDPDIITGAFKDYLNSIGLTFESINPESGFKALLDFFTEVKFDWVGPEPLDDMLLYQYGMTHDFSSPCDPESGKRDDIFYLNLTRQLCRQPSEDDEIIDDDANIYQLAVTFEYDPKGFEQVDTETQWSADLKDFDSFKKLIFESQGFRASMSHEPRLIKILTDQC